MLRHAFITFTVAAASACRAPATDSREPPPAEAVATSSASLPSDPTRLFEPAHGLTAAAVPDASVRARLNALHDALQRGDARRGKLVAALSKDELQVYLAALARVRREDRQDGHGQSDLEWTFFAPELQPDGLRVLVTEMLAEARARDLLRMGVFAPAQMALDGPAEAAPIFREIAAWPCAIDSGGLAFTTVVDKAIAAAALTRLGTPEDAAKALASLRACREASADEHDREVADRAEAALRSVPPDAEAWRAWFEETFGDELSSD